MTDEHLRTAVEKVLPGKLASRALAEGANAISRYRVSLAATEDDFGEDLSNDGETDLAERITQLRDLYATTSEQGDAYDEEDS